MPESTKSFHEDVTREKALPLKERLVAFRARNMGKRILDINKPISGRLGDITKPLMQVIKLVKPGKEKILSKLILRLQEKKKVDQSESTEANLLRAIKSKINMQKNGLLSVEIITDTYNKQYAGKYTLTNKSVGWKLRAMGFDKGRLGSGSNIKLDEMLLHTLSDKYGLKLMKKKISTKKTNIKKKLNKRHKRHVDNILDGKTDVVSNVVSLEQMKTSLKQHR